MSAEEDKSVRHEVEYQSTSNYGRPRAKQFPQGLNVKSLVTVCINKRTHLEVIDTNGNHVQYKAYDPCFLNGMIIRKCFYDTWIDVLIGEDVHHLQADVQDVGVSIAQAIIKD